MHARSSLISIISLLTVWALAGCDASSPCDKGQRYSVGMCVDKPAPRPVPTSDASTPDAAAPDATVLDAGACSEPLTDSLGKDCTTDPSVCGCSAPYCAINPFTNEGYCTLHCTTAPNDDCPAGYFCFDLATVVTGDPNIPDPFCAPN